MRRVKDDGRRVTPTTITSLPLPQPPKAICRRASDKRLADVGVNYATSSLPNLDKYKKN